MKNNNRKRAAVLFFILLYLALACFHSLLHNHKPDLRHHKDCPVFCFIMEAKATLGFFLFSLFLLFLVLLRYRIPQKKVRQQSLYYVRGNRAPPSFA
jgi:hypothetical protein